MDTSENIKEVVKNKYSQIATTNASRNESCCGPGAQQVIVMTEDYSKVQGYRPEADLGLGCGIPTDVVNIKAGETVLDLGSGAGNDVFVARDIVGDNGLVIGVDMTPAMIERAEANRKKLGFTNVEFRLGEIENLPVESNFVDVVVSNCVLNLVPNKSKAFSEIFRVLKPGGRFGISDIVTRGRLPEKVRTVAELYAGCVAGAEEKLRYLEIIGKTGFVEVSVKRERAIHLPDSLLGEYLSKEEIEHLRNDKVGIASITVFGQKPV
jgi:SAM-dependent methyltransferase